MSKALIAGINQVATDKGLDREVIFEAIEAALISAYKRNYGSVANVTSEVDRVTGDMRGLRGAGGRRRCTELAHGSIAGRCAKGSSRCAIG